MNNVFKALYSATIDRSKFREIAQRYVVFLVPLVFLGDKPHTIGIIVAAVGVLIRAWAAGYLHKDQSLARSGPYLVARHPLYLGSCLLALGLILTLQNWFVTLFLGGLTALVYNHTIRHEEKNLSKRFGADYENLMQVTGPLWPKPVGLKLLFKNPKKGFSGFSFRQYLKNKEYECLLGVIVVFGLLYFFAP